jgi:hypothetical protein
MPLQINVALAYETEEPGTQQNVRPVKLPFI